MIRLPDRRIVLFSVVIGNVITVSYRCEGTKRVCYAIDIKIITILCRQLAISKRTFRTFEVIFSREEVDFSHGLY